MTLFSTYNMRCWNQFQQSSRHFPENSSDVIKLSQLQFSITYLLGCDAELFGTWSYLPHYTASHLRMPYLNTDCCENSALTPCILFPNFSPAKFTTNSKACMGVGLIAYRNVAFTGHNIKKKVPHRYQVHFTLYQVVKAQRKGRGIPLLFL